MRAEEGKSHCGNAGRVDEFVELFARAQQKLYVYILSLVFNATDAYDVLQDTNLALWQRFDDFEPGTDFLAWALAIARYRALRFRQHQKSRRETLDDDLLANLATEIAHKSETLQAERLRALEECLASLPAQDREIIQSRYEPAGSLRSLAQKIGRSENALSQALRRIRKTLAECTKRRLDMAPGVGL
jgi:RNA polymerase sigma-70 factor, ECF subfamily